MAKALSTKITHLSSNYGISFLFSITGKQMVDLEHLPKKHVDTGLGFESIKYGDSEKTVKLRHRYIPACYTGTFQDIW